MCGSFGAVFDKECREYRLESEEHKHSNTRREEQNSATKTVYQERGTNSHDQIPNLQATIDK